MDFEYEKKLRKILFQKDSKENKLFLLNNLFADLKKEKDKNLFSFKHKLKKRINNLKKSSTNWYKEDFDFDNAFEILNYSFGYSKNKSFSIKNINLNIKFNKVTTFIGPSGSGKSTLLRSLNKIAFENSTPFKNGEIYFRGLDIFSNIIPSELLRSQIGMIFQKPTPFPISIYENIALPLRCQGIKEESEIEIIVKHTLEEVGLYDEVKNNLWENATELSGGQQQRLCIARAICLRPKILLLDEPTSSLDPIATAKIENLILKLKKEYTIILVSHSMHQTQRVSDETAFFYKGELIEKGNTKEIFMAPKNEITKKYLEGKL
ncbi:phosphate ABC transporter ATP-binding protein [Metamycoplasma buccale]|uniref:phosphate ABC transporter ATP-binding protein n=1 Tax=Metamycoplasma buccale TaxID=55602 RepID=UPI00398E356B